MNWIYKKYLANAIKKRIKNDSDRIGTYNVYLKSPSSNSAYYLRAMSVENGIIECIELDSDSPGHPLTGKTFHIPLSEIKIDDVRHIVKFPKYDYDSVYLFVLNEIFPIQKISETWECIKQRLYNLFPKEVSKYHRVLETISTKFTGTFHPLELLNALYGDRIHNSPKYHEYEKSLEGIIHDLCQQGIINAMPGNSSYRINTAISAFANISVNEQHHRENRRTNSIIAWLTGILAVAAIGSPILQTGIIKFPTLLDFSTTSKIELIIVDNTKPDYSLPITKLGK